MRGRQRLGSRETITVHDSKDENSGIFLFLEIFSSSVFCFFEFDYFYCLKQVVSFIIKKWMIYWFYIRVIGWVINEFQCAIGVDSSVLWITPTPMGLGISPCRNKFVLCMTFAQHVSDNLDKWLSLFFSLIRHSYTNLREFKMCWSNDDKNNKFDYITLSFK